MQVAARRLNTNIPSAGLYYINRLEELIMKHKIVDRVGQAHENSTSKASLKIKLDNIDEEQKYYMLHDEKSLPHQVRPYSILTRLVQMDP